MKPTKFNTKSVKARKSADSSMKAAKEARGSAEELNVLSSSITDEPEDPKEQLEDVLTAGKERFEKAMEGWTKIRMRALQDLKFYQGEQIDAKVARASAVRNEPNLKSNRLPQFVKQIENELRRQSISVNVYPTDETGSEETAEVFAGLIRDIERKSHATSAYIHAAGESGAMVPGFGFLKLETVWTGKTGFTQDIRITSPADPFKIIPDPDAMEPDSSDAQCWFEFEDYSEDAYRRLFPSSEVASYDASVIGSRMPTWIGPNGVRVVKYWYKEELELIEYMLEDGTMVNNIGWYDPNEEVDELDDQRSPFPTKLIETPDGPKEVKKAVLRSRQTTDTKVKWVIFNGCEVLDHGEWADSEFPFVSVYGPTLIVDGDRDIRGVIRYAKDTQQQINYISSSLARRMGSANKSPWIASAAAIKGYEKYWMTANTENWSLMLFNDVDPNNPNRTIAPPQRADQTSQLNDLLAAGQKLENDLKATIGIYDAGLGATANEQSGVAIKTLAEQGQNANYHFSDALERAIQRLGFLLIRLIPKIYDTPRVVRIIGADNQEKLVKVNQIFTQNGQQKMFNLAEGDYGIAVAAGPAYASRKSKALDQIQRLTQADPTILPVIQDILVGEMDFDKAPVIQDRLTRLYAMQFPQLQTGDGQPPVPPQALAAMQQQGDMIKKLSEELLATHNTLQELQFKVNAKIIDHEQQKEIIQLKMKADLMVEEARAEVAKYREQAKMEADMATKRLDYTHDMTKLVVEAAKDGHLHDIARSADAHAFNPQGSSS